MVTPSFNARRWVLITGASAGIGEAFARRFAREGWNTVLVARSRDKLESLARSLGQQHGAETLVIACDLSQHDATDEIYRKVKEAGIRLEGLVNNAAIGAHGKFHEVVLDRYLSMIDLNVRSLVQLTHLFLHEMMDRSRGMIINVSSTACYQPLSYSSVYAATKSFVTSFTEALWLETKGTGVRVLNLCPGVTKTDFGTAAGMRNFRQDPLAEEPEAVVETAFRALKHDQPTAVSGWQNRLRLFLERLMPHRVLLAAVDVYQKTVHREER
ncbi:MAG: hypothetical protein A3G87_10085 [Omnitrophica bacterium RIFCSPLOWO2_12_FULL_50_11]|nr:MAG: hypothetical protein A3G87_10085 [Omnitrophica bacterium RIFCSPLOWO2_12_FULL_50_11]